METIKSLFRAIAKKKYEKESTKELTSKQVDEVYDEVNRLTSSFGIHFPFPSGESLIDQNRENDII